MRLEAKQLEREAGALRGAGGERYTRAQRRARGWRALATNLGRLARDLAEDARSWVRVENAEGLSFKPVFVRRYAHRLL